MNKIGTRVVSVHKDEARLKDNLHLVLVYVLRELVVEEGMGVLRPRHRFYQ